MAGGWVKTLQCKSRAYEDVYHHHPQPKQLLLSTSTSCRNSYQNLKDVVVDHNKPKPKSKPNPVKPMPFVKRSESVKPKPKPKPEKCVPSDRVRRTVSAPLGKGVGLGMLGGLGSGRVSGPGVGPFFPSVAELAEGHPSRNVVEIIFHTRWGPKGFSGRVEMVFKVQSMARTLARFEEYRGDVKGRAGPGSGARCVADGNEMMRFHCLGPTGSGNVMDSTGMCGMDDGGGKGAVSTSICTYSGSGAAHESAGGGCGRRAMVVCRVIAGRVSKRVGLGLDSVLSGKGGSGDLEFDSVSGENGELLVFDNRAVLPCFLVIYKL